MNKKTLMWVGGVLGVILIYKWWNSSSSGASPDIGPVNFFGSVGSGATGTANTNSTFIGPQAPGS